MADLAIRDLTVSYGRHMVIQRLSLEPWAGGRITALVGPNAAGKSTLLRALAGLVPARGSVRLGGTELLELDHAARARLVTFMPQSLPQGVAFTVLDALIAAFKASPGARADYSLAEVRDRAGAVIDRLGIAEIALRMIDRLSGGQRQMAALGQSLMLDPELLLLDEPTSALDLRHQADVMGVLRSLAAEGLNIVVVVHDLALAARWADHIVVLDRGGLHAQGSPADVVTPGMLAEVYGVSARVERCSRSFIQIGVDGPLETSPETIR